MKFKKKPIEINAEVWLPGCGMDGVDEVDVAYYAYQGMFGEAPSFSKEETQRMGRIKTLEGFLYVRPGDYVVTGPFGERYPVKKDIFESTYDRVEE